MTWFPSPRNKPRLFCFFILLKLSVIVTTVFIIIAFHPGNEFTDFITKRLLTRRIESSKLSQENTEQRQHVLLFIGIISAPQLIFRRNALRRSWLSQCKNYNISCWIFTDGQDMNGKRLPGHIYVPLKQEQYLHGDLILAESPGGINFARRYLWMIQWASERYKFDFMLRVDDDYFICMHRLLLELPNRPKKKLYWGHVHCQPAGGIRVDEGFVIVSNDLVQEFLREQNKTLMCHPYGDQAMAIWINNIPGVTYFGDTRVHHAVSARDPILQYYRDVCGNCLALHGSYPLEIERFWVKHSSTTRFQKYTIPEISYPCGNQDKKYNTTNFLGMYHAEPVLCKKMPKWKIGEFYGGRNQ